MQNLSGKDPDGAISIVVVPSQPLTQYALFIEVQTVQSRNALHH